MTEEKSSANFLKRFFRTPAARPISARTLMRLILTSQKLLPVALAAQFEAILIFEVMFWKSSINRIFLINWGLAAALYIYFSLRFVRRFWRDRDRVARIRLWLRRSMALAVFGGLIWGTAGAAFLVPVSGIEQVVTVALIVAVTFASWPAFSSWMPSLTTFTLLSLVPLIVSVAVQYGVSQTMMAAVTLMVLIFILYSGRCLNDMMTASILTDAENRRLVGRLREEIHRSETGRRRAEEESAVRARFFAAANHDIRQPLQALGICLDILKRRAAPSERPIIDQLVLTSTTISTLVEQVLEVTRMEFSQFTLHPEEVDLRVLLESLEREFRPVAQKKGVALRIRPLPIVVTTDPQLLQRALRNLVSNAISYTDPGGDVVIGVRLLRGTHVTIGVYDSGPGISREERKRIFETFYRGSVGRSRPGSGFGLGLSIVRGICKQLGIALTVGSHVGRGSVFRLEMETSESEQLRLLNDAPGRPREEGGFRGTVALVEDNGLVRESLAEALRHAGAKVLSAEAPHADLMAKAAEAANADPRTVLLTDYNLLQEGVTGLDVIGELEERTGRDFPAVMLTAVARDRIEVDFAGRAGRGLAHPKRLPAILQKPASVEVILEALAAAVGPAEEAREEKAPGEEEPDA